MAENMDRRKFLKIIGGGSALVVLGAGCQSLGFSTTANSGSTTACKFGYINDPWPGECRDYVDKNGNGVCDYSEVSSTTDTTTAESPSETTVETNTTDQSTIQQAQTDSSNSITQQSPTEVPTEVPSGTANQTADLSNTTTQQTQTESSELVVLCRKGCSYPGHCNQYVDSNATGVCDLSEGVAMTTYQAAQTGRQRPGGRNK